MAPPLVDAIAIVVGRPWASRGGTLAGMRSQPTSARVFAAASVVTPAHRRITRTFSSPLLGGPPYSELLEEISAHLFTEEEAELVQHLPPLRPRTAAAVARAAACDEPSARAVLDRLALEKMVLLAFGEPRKYALLPVVPGTFELALMTTDLRTRTDWHRRFAVLFERLWDTGFMRDYTSSTRPPVRYLPVGAAIENPASAWPSDKLEEILADYDDFAVGHCQCRMAMRFTDQGCGRETENCTTFGKMAGIMVERGLMRRVDRQEILAIKRAAEAEGSVTWMGNVAGGGVNGSCSCCGCCCHALRTISELNAPGMIARPHFVPVLDAAACTACGKCTRICPVKAFADSEDRAPPRWDERRCIGCGLCVVHCPTRALELSASEAASRPDASLASMLLKMAPGYLANTVSVATSRMLRKG
jgi:Pyruvate/2-oxoacid:ferredoxin oxidoreductase delta subunit